MKIVSSYISGSFGNSGYLTAWYELHYSGAFPPSPSNIYSNGIAFNCIMYNADMFCFKFSVIVEALKAKAFSNLFSFQQKKNNKSLLFTKTF